jgi:hypothetical protein
MGRHFLMPEQPEPKPSAPPAPASDEQGPGPRSGQGWEQTVDMQLTPTNQSPAQTETPERIPYWLQQAERFLRLIVRIYLGLLVCMAPWYPPAWDTNPLFARSPWLTQFITYGAVRGLVSGLGLLNLWIAFRDALRNPEDPNSR